LKKDKIILYSLFLTGVVSCSSFKPIVLNAYLDPATTTEVNYDDINWSYALFNQFASGLSYTIRLNYSNLINFPYVTNSIRFNSSGGSFFFNSWDTVTSSFAEANLDATWTNRFNSVLFNRDFDRVTKKIAFVNSLQFYRYGNYNQVNFEIIIKSRIAYSVNIGSAFMAFHSISSAGSVDFYFKFLEFYNSNDQLLQRYLLDQDRSNIVRNYVYDLDTITTNVKRFDLKLQWGDIPPQATSDAFIFIGEFNLFTQQQEISIPDDTSGDLFGFEFVAVEWWNFLGHAQNFIWWIVNQSPVRFVFEFIDTYIVTWVSGLITLITGVFDL
jgi:hypothetical protein